MAQPPPDQPNGIRRTILLTLPIPELRGWESRLVLLEYPPDFKAPLHKHPRPATGYVLEGSVVSQWEGGEIESYVAGDSFVDLGETVHLRSENTSTTGWLRMVMSYVIKVEQPNIVPL
ncbi:hypothetical protein LTR10_008563 [Elasticomyces elasticus]|nr:hypothetical protein LTR10_008563 [Elasticomyces elasticus]KAK4967436.1 hypothetical protein LTR42_010785 [Elasticomyces elasticus]